MEHELKGVRPRGLLELRQAGSEPPLGCNAAPPPGSSERILLQYQVEVDTAPCAPQFSPHFHVCIIWPLPPLSPRTLCFGREAFSPFSGFFKYIGDTVALAGRSCRGLFQVAASS